MRIMWLCVFGPMSLATQLLPPPMRLCFHHRLLVCLFVCLQDYVNSTRPLCTKFGRKVTCGPRQNRLVFGGNLDHITLGFW